MRIEKLLDKVIDETEVVALLKQLVAIPSVSYAESDLAGFLVRWFHGIGVEAKTDAHGNVFASIGSGNPVLLLHAHIDTVAVGNDWKTDPFKPEILDGQLTGRGSCDTKGGLASILAAFKALTTGEARQGTVLFAGVVTEEVSPPENKGTMKAIRDGLKADMAIVAEPTGLDICIAEIGRLEYELTTKGKISHANAPEQGVNAIMHMARAVMALEANISRPFSDILQRFSTFNVGTIQGGIQSNMVPAECKVLIDRGLVPGQSPEESTAEMQRILDGLRKEHPDFQAELTMTYKGFPAEVSADHPLARALKASADTLSVPSKVTGFISHCDADWLITYAGIPSVIFGPGDLRLAHTSHESVPVREVVDAAKIILLTAYAMLKGEPA